jgi:carboxyl-terminal processing protease
MDRKFKRVSAIFLAVCWALPVSAVAGEYYRPVEPRTDRFENVGSEVRLAQVVRLVEQSNAANLVGRDRWRSLLAEHRKAIEQTSTHDEFARAVNALIKATGVSHFGYWGDHQWTYWFLGGTFWSGTTDVRVEHVGLYAEEIDGRWFVRGVFEGAPAEATVIRVGDEVLSVNGRPYSPIESFRGLAGKPARMRLRRAPGLIYNVVVTPVRDSLFDTAQRATRESISVIRYDGLDLAYMHAWTLLGRGDEYRLLRSLQDEVDGLLLDYRDGFGGTWHAAARFLLGRRNASTGRRQNPDWRKPVVILTADGTRSAKEIVVDAVQRYGRGLLVGLPTPGAVTSVGGVRRVGDDGLLLLPGQILELEGKPTQPDYLVERDIRYCAGDDPQLVAAASILAALIRDASAAMTKYRKAG